jgi:hypothetical protein
MDKKTDMALLVVSGSSKIQRWRRPRGRSERAAEWNTDSYRRPSSRVVNNPKAARSCFLVLGSNNYPGLCLCSDLCFYFPVPSHPPHPSIRLPSVTSSLHLFFLSHLNRLSKSTHSHTTVIMVSHCQTRLFLHAPKQALTTARSRNHNISPTLRL